MTNVESLTSNVCGGIDKKRIREIVDVSALEAIVDHHEQPNKKMTTMNITKDV